MKKLNRRPNRFRGQTLGLDLHQRMIRYALSRAPRESTYLDTYGWLLYKKGSFANAKKWLLRADRARAEADPVIRDHLGDVCWRLGRSEEAIEHWTKAVETVRQRPEDELNSEDERRVLNSTQQKIEDARAGRPPTVAPLAAEPAKENGGTEGEVSDS